MCWRVEHPNMWILEKQFSPQHLWSEKGIVFPFYQLNAGAMWHRVSRLALYSSPLFWDAQRINSVLGEPHNRSLYTFKPFLNWVASDNLSLYQGSANTKHYYMCFLNFLIVGSKKTFIACHLTGGRVWYKRSWGRNKWSYQVVLVKNIII